MLFALLPLLAAGWARADPGYYVVTAYDNAGQASVDFRYWTVQSKGGREWIWPELGFAYGVNSRWTTELFTSYIGPSNWDLVPSTLNWQNDVLLTQGEWPVDVAVHTQLVRESGYSGKVYAFEYGPALQTDFGRTQVNANLFFERTFEEDAEPIQLKYQWQLRHRWRPWLNVGAQGFGELGRWNHWASGGEQSHRAGPAVFGHVDFGDLGQHQSLLYQAAYLIGTTYAKRGHMFTLRLQFAF